MASKEWDYLPHAPWVDDMPIYQYYSDLQENTSCKEFKKVNDVFLGKLVFELQGRENDRMSEEAKQVVQIYGCYYIQFPRFTYIKVGGFPGEPLKLPRYCSDSVVLSEMCRQFVSVVESFQISKRSSSIFFPIEIGHYRCPSLKEAILSAKSLTHLCFKPFISRLDFDYTSFVRNNVKNAISLFHSPQLEDFWANFHNEFEVRKILWSQLTIK